MMKNNSQETSSPENFSSLVGELKEEVNNYVKYRSDYIKLDLIEKASKLISKLALSIALVCISLIAFMFFTITIGVYLGQLFDNAAAGFGCLVLIWLILLLIVYLNRSSLKRIIRDRCLLALYNIQKEEEDQDE